MNKEIIEKLLDDLIVSSVAMKNAIQNDDLMTFYKKSRDLMNAIEILKQKADLATPLTPRWFPDTLREKEKLYWDIKNRKSPN